MEPTPGSSFNPNFKFTRKNSLNVAELFEQLRQGNMAALSRAVTLIESQKTEHQALAAQLIQLCIPFSGNSVRIGITGIPGAGKSTCIEAIGTSWANQDKKVAVLAVDPSSQVSGGSILGDKTRMETLSQHPQVFIRPSPSGGSLGGVARMTRETMLLCEAAGYELILVETVGVGQSEVAVHSMVDLFVLLAIPGAGDELQGIKRGIMEMADLIVVNKAEGENLPRAKLTARQLENALHLFPPGAYGIQPQVLLISALHFQGIDQLIKHMQAVIDCVKANTMFESRRRHQALYWFQTALRQQILDFVLHRSDIQAAIASVEKQVSDFQLNPFEAAQQVFKLIKDR